MALPINRVLMTSAYRRQRHDRRDRPSSGTNVPFSAANWFVDGNRTASSVTTITAGTGSSNAGGLYSFGLTPANDRALGLLASVGPTPVPSIGVEFSNT